jgi:hypothetical protein
MFGGKVRLTTFIYGRPTARRLLMSSREKNVHIFYNTYQMRREDTSEVEVDVDVCPLAFVSDLVIVVFPPFLTILFVVVVMVVMILGCLIGSTMSESGFSRIGGTTSVSYFSSSSGFGWLGAARAQSWVYSL